MTSAPATTQLWQHQQDALDFIAGKPGAMLAMEMGCGKTLAAIEHIRRTAAKRILVIAPLSVVDHVWPDQIARHAGGRLDAVALGQRHKSTRAKLQAADIAIAKAGPNRPLAVIVNYETTLRPEFRHWAALNHWDLLILDESHRVKAPDGKIAQWLARLAPDIPRRLALTGTPMPHSPMDLFRQYRILDPSIFGTSYHRFRDTYAQTAEIPLPITSRRQPTTARRIVGTRNEEQLAARFRRIAHEVRAADVLELPPVNRLHYRIRLSPKGETVYRQMARHFFAEVETGVIHAGNALAQLLRLQQITGGFLPGETEDAPPTRVDDAKSRALKDILESLPPEEPMVAFVRFKADLDECLAAARAAGRPAWEMSGRVKELDQWNEKGGMLAAQIQAGSEGIDLTKARYCIFYSLGYSLGDYLQAQARLHRPGQERTVHQLHLIAAGTVDEKVIRALERREDAILAILEQPETDG